MLSVRDASFLAFRGLAVLAVPAALLAQFAEQSGLDDFNLYVEDFTVCFIDGAWPSGSPIGYQAWDQCSQLTVRRVTLADVRGQRPVGLNTGVTVSDIPRGAPIIEISNEYSAVLIFPDEFGLTQEIRTRD